MATHPRGKVALVPHAASISTRLDKLLTEYEEKAAAIRTVMSLLNGHAQTAATRNGSSVLAKALSLEAQRRGVVEDEPAGVRKGSVVREKRTATAATLAQFDPTTPRRVGDGRAVTTYVRHGFLAKKGDGYIRTAKPFYVSVHEQRQQQAPRRTKTRAKRKSGWSHDRRARRIRSAALLKQFNTETPKPSVGIPDAATALGPLVRRGYLRAKGDGYLRTAKEFTP